MKTTYILHVLKKTYILYDKRLIKLFIRNTIMTMNKKTIKITETNQPQLMNHWDQSIQSLAIHLYPEIHSKASV